MPSPPPAEYIAHRGAKREHPENTIPAFVRAIDLGADGVELDVHRTRDGSVVVHHDAEVSLPVAPLTRRPISETDLAELAQVDLGGGASIPTLADTLDLLRGRATAYVEIKGRGIEADVIEVVRRHGGECAIHSFDHAAIIAVRRLAPEIPRGLLFDRETAGLEAIAREAAARDIWPHWSLVDRSLCELVSGFGGRTIVWTVNDAATAAHLIDCGVAGICGDDIRVFPPR